MSDDRFGATEPSKHENAFDVAPNWIKLLVALIFVLWVVGVFATLFFLKRYLPSHIWLETIEPFATIFSAVAALTCTVLVFLGFLSEERRTGQRKNRFFLAFTLIFSVFLFYLPTVDLLRRGIPAMIAVAWGERVEHPFVIADPGERSTKWCHQPIELRGMPAMTELCEMPQEFRSQLHSGMSVVFIGKGTWMGLFVEDFRKP